MKLARPPLTPLKALVVPIGINYTSTKVFLKKITFHDCVVFLNSSLISLFANYRRVASIRIILVVAVGPGLD